MSDSFPSCLLSAEEEVAETAASMKPRPRRPSGGERLTLETEAFIRRRDWQGAGSEHFVELYRILHEGIAGNQFEFYVVSAAPVEVIRAALENIVPADHIFGTQLRYSSSGEIEAIAQLTAGYGKVAVLDRLQEDLQIGSDRIVYVGDGSSDVHVMLHINRRDGFTIAVSENKHLAPIARRTVLSANALGVLIPILEEIVGWNRAEIRSFMESQGFLIQEWDKVSTDVLTIRDSTASGLLNPQAEAASA